MAKSPGTHQEEGIIPQALLPLIADGATRISDIISVIRENGRWTYFCGVQPVFQHAENDHRSFRMFTAQLICQGVCRQVDIVRAFGISKNSVIRSVNKYRAGGVNAFYTPRATRGASVMTPAVTAQAQQLLAAGWSLREVAERLGIKLDTLRKAMPHGRLTVPCPVKPGEPAPEKASVPPPPTATDKSTRAVEDAVAEMGTACTRPDERVLAAFGLLDGAPTRFETCRDVPFGGVLCALPALEANGLFRHIHDCLARLRGYYSTLHVIVLLAHMALCRIKTVEQLQYEHPGELGKLLGLDRVPEVRCLRHKLAALSIDDGPQKWAGLLSRDWLKAEPELAGALYVDGHVRLYHGSQTALPKRYVSRQRLCLRGTTDYWVNDALGQPFFAVERTIDHGLLEVLKSDIVPRLLKDVPGQPTEAELKADRYRARFVILFDREGYSPEFFKDMWQTHRIACITYHKYPKDDWPADEFAEVETTLPNGERVKLQLAERGTWIGDRKSGLWVRETRKLTTSGHQVSLISSAFGESAREDSVRLFSRWSQENFFRYMMQHFAIDLLNEYGSEEIPETKRPVVNPKWRELDRRKRSVKSKLTHRQARFAALTLHPEPDETAQVKWEKRKAELVEEIEQFEKELADIDKKSKETPGHLAWDEMPETEKFQRLAPSRKQLVDTVKMIAYRAETALASIVREKLVRTDDARTLLRDLFRSEADLVPDMEQGVLRVHVHPMSNPRSNRAIAHLLEHLNAAEFPYPGTNLRLIYSIAGEAETPNLVTLKSRRSGGLILEVSRILRLRRRQDRQSVRQATLSEQQVDAEDDELLDFSGQSFLSLDKGVLRFLPVPLVPRLTTCLLNQETHQIEPQLGLALHDRQQHRDRLVQLVRSCQRPGKLDARGVGGPIALDEPPEDIQAMLIGAHASVALGQHQVNCRGDHRVSDKHGPRAFQ